MTPAYSRKERGASYIDAALTVQVILTRDSLTGCSQATATLTAARELARGLGARIELLLAVPVPYPLPLDQPPMALEFMRRTLGQIAAAAALETSAELCLCRDVFETLRQILPPESVVVMAKQAWWRPGGQRRLASILRRGGHHVVLIDPRQPVRVAELTEQEETARRAPAPTWE